MRGLSLYSGVAGLDIAAEAAGVEVVAFCEPEPFCRAVLAARYPGVPIYEYDTDITAERLEEDNVGQIDIVYGGCPCQPASAAGKQLGSADSRWRWPEALRIVGALRPRWVVFENPRGIQSVGERQEFGRILHRLAEMGYSVGYGVWGAADVGAPHKRERVFVICRLLADAPSAR